MTPDIAYCRDLVAAHDRDRFTLTMGAPAHLRPALWAVLAFNHEIAKTRDVTRESVTGHIRLTWWRDALTEGRYTHEVLGALRPAIAAHNLPVSLFVDLIDARMRDIDHLAPGNLPVYAAQTNVPLLQLCARILGSSDDVQALGTAYGLTGIMRALPHGIQHNRVLLTPDMMDVLGVAPEQFSHIKPKDDLNAMVRDICAQAGALLDTAHPTTKFFRMQATMTRLYLNALRRADYNPFDSRYVRDVPFMALRILF